jgi:hypothetical protein
MNTQLPVTPVARFMVGFNEETKTKRYQKGYVHGWGGNSVILAVTALYRVDFNPSCNI